LSSRDNPLSYKLLAFMTPKTATANRNSFMILKE
jgi:hypothetical protein